MDYLALVGEQTTQNTQDVAQEQTTYSPNKKDEKDYQKEAIKTKKIHDLIKKWDMYFISADSNTKNNGFWIWYDQKQNVDGAQQNLVETVFPTFEKLRDQFTEELLDVTKNDLLLALQKKKRKFYEKVFTIDEMGDTVYNMADNVCKNMMKIDFESEGEKSDVLDTLFLSVAGGCVVSKEVIEKSMVSLILNTINKNWGVSYLPPTVLCYGNGATGKSLLFNTLMPRIFDRKNTFIINNDLAKGRFSQYIMAKRLLVYNEITMSLSERTAFTNKIKSYLESIISIEGKGTNAEQVPFMAWMVILSNGQDGAVDVRGADGVSRRFQVMEGRKCLGEMLVDAGVYVLNDEQKKKLKNDCKTYDQRVLFFDEITKVNFGHVFEDDEILKKHVEYLIRKYHKELKKSDFKVSAVHTSAFDKLVTNQQGQYQENFIDWVHKTMTFDKDYKIKDLYQMLDTWAGKSQVRPYSLPDFEKSIINILRNRPEVKYVKFCKLDDKQKHNIRIGNKHVSMTGLYIKKDDYELMQQDILNGCINDATGGNRGTGLFEETKNDEVVVLDKKDNNNAFAGWKIE